MRVNFTKLMTASMVAGAALLLSACGSSQTANVSETNVTDMSTNMDDSMEGTMNDVTAVDATMGSDANMAMDSNATLPMDGNAAAPAGNASNAM